MLKIIEQYLCNWFKGIQNIINPLPSTASVAFYFSEQLGFISFIPDLCTPAPLFLFPGNFRSLILPKGENVYKCHVTDILRTVEGFQGFFFFHHLSGELNLSLSLSFCRTLTSQPSASILLVYFFLLGTKLISHLSDLNDITTSLGLLLPAVYQAAIIRHTLKWICSYFGFRVFSLSCLLVFS